MYYVHCLIGALLMFVFPFITPPAPITPLGMQVLGIFLGLIYMWSTVEILWPSVMGLFALCLSDYETTADVVAESFGNSTAVLMLCFLAIAVVIEECRLAEYLCNVFLSVKIFRGRPWLFTLCWFLVIGTMASCVSMMLVAITFWAVFYEIADTVGYKKGEAYTSLMIIGTLVFSAIGSIIMPFNGIALIANGAYQGMGREGIVYMYYIPTIAIIVYVMIFGYVGLMRWVFKADASKLKNMDFAKLVERKKPMTKMQKTVVICLLVAIILLLMPGVVPQSTKLGAMVNKVGATGIVLGAFAFFSFLKVDGVRVLSFTKVVGKMSWSLYFVIATAMCVSNALTSEGTGISEFVLGHLTPILSNMSPWGFIVLLTIIAVVLTNVANNIVVCLSLLSVLAVYASQYSINEPVAMTVLMIAAMLGYMLPSSSITGAMMHGNEWLSPKEIYKYIFVLLIWMTFCTIVLGAGLGMLFY